MSIKLNDTIAAIATPAGYGALSVIRLSGVNALEILKEIFKGKKGEFLSHTVAYGHIVDKEGGVLDEVLVTVMLAPRTYTREDTVEISCHGGIRSANAVLKRVLECGARLAEAGEFTKRAFLNGRIDLTQAEAVIDVINAKTELSHRAAINRLKGTLSQKVKAVQDKVLSMLAAIEASIDYPEHDMEQTNLDSVNEQCGLIIEEIKQLIKKAEVGKILQSGVETAIVGKPNVGKSSLLNAILGEERAIVTNIAGTTRDVLTEYIDVSGIPFKLTDTAGIRDTQDIVEQMGVERSKNTIDSAMLVLLVLDGSCELESDDLKLIELINNGEKETIFVINKCDLPQKIDKGALNGHVISISASNNEGIDKLFEKMERLFYDAKLLVDDEEAIASLRHKEVLKSACESLLRVKSTIEAGFTEDLAAIDLQACYRQLGEITGESASDDLLDRIFSEFCLGK